MTKDNSTGKNKEFYDLGKKMFDRLNPTEEDEAWQELERKQQQAQELDVRREAQTKAIEFIENNSAIELGIMTLRKAFEIGYRRGVYAESWRRDAKHKS